MVNGMKLTKQWQVNVGKIGDFSKFPDVEAQVVVKQENGFVPAEEASGGADDKAGGVTQPASGQEAGTGVSVEGSAGAPGFTNMTVEQLKSFLIAKGVAQSELRNATKSELIERAEFIWSQNN
jgi:hypothetical protein